MLLKIAILLASWSQFRGPNSSGISDGHPLPADIGPEKNVVWKVSLPAGKSSPVVTGDRIYLTGHEGDKLLTLAIDTKSGRELWRRELDRPRKEARHKLNDAAAPTPTTDGSHVYVFFADFGLIAYSREGKEAWRLPLGPFVSLQGVVSSPILMGDRLILVCDQTRDSFIIAVDKRTGKQLWRQERAPSQPGAYSTPNQFGDQLLVLGSFELAAYQPATGERLWWTGSLPGQPKSSPILMGDVIYTAGKGGAENRIDLPPWETALKAHDQDSNGSLSRAEMPVPLLKSLFAHLDTSGDGALQQTEWENVLRFTSARSTLAAIHAKQAKGDVTASAIRWRHERNIPDVPTPLAYRGMIYIVQSGGILTALDPVSGEVRKQGRLPEALGDYYASPVAGDGKIFTLSQAGKLTVVQAGAEWEVLRTVDFGEECFATPALVDGSIYVRTATALYRFSR